MSARTKARKRALDILFQADIRGDDLVEHVSPPRPKRAASEPAREASWLYAREIVDGVIDNRDEIDEHITTLRADWTLERMPAVDRALLRIGVWEILYNDEVPDRRRDRRGRRSWPRCSRPTTPPGFVNGLLAAISHSKG